MFVGVDGSTQANGIGNPSLFPQLAGNNDVGLSAAKPVK
jgi:hypothetical protein